MTNFGNLLGTFLQSNMAQSGQQRIGNALQGLQAGSASDPATGGGGLLGNLLGMAQSSLDSASRNPLQAGGLGAVVGSVLGGGGDSMKGALAGGALAMLAGVALKALDQAGQGRAEARAAGSVPTTDGSLPLVLEAPESAAEQQVLDTKAQLVLKGMINIAKSDGQVGIDELQKIIGKAEDMAADDKDWLMRELQQPLDLNAFAAEIPSQEVAAEIYAASLLAVEVDTPEEREYLRQFAEKTALHPMIVQHIHQTMGVPL